LYTRYLKLLLLVDLNNNTIYFRFALETAVYQYSSLYGYGDKQIIGDTWLITTQEAIRYFTVSGDGQCIPLNGNSYSQNPSEEFFHMKPSNTIFLNRNFSYSQFNDNSEFRTEDS
jgi:hypothetical protein